MPSPPQPRTLQDKVYVFQSYRKRQRMTKGIAGAIVTGSSRGIGKAIAFDLASRGARVVFTYTSDRSKEPSNELISRIESEADSSAIAVQCDLLNPDAPEKVVKAALEVYGPHIDILVNNAAIISDKYVQDVSTEHFDEVFHLNVRAPMLMVQAVLPHLQRPGRDILHTNVSDHSIC